MKVLRMSREDLLEFSGMMFPILIEQFFLASIGILITLLVRKTGMAAVASVGLMNSVNILINNVFTSIGVGVSVVIAQYRGKNDTKATGRVAQQGVMMAVFVAMVVGAIGFALREPILRLLLADSEPLVYEYSRIYFSHYLAAIPFMATYSVCAAAIRGSGHPSTSVIAVMTYNGAYAFLAFLATTFTDMGLLGVCRSQIAGAVIAAVVGLVLLFKGNEHMQIGRIEFKIDREVIKPMLRVGIPVMLENVLFSLGRLITQTYAVSYGTNEMAANGIVNNINLFMSVPIMAAVHAAPPIIGRYCGKGDKENAMLKGKQLVLLVFAVQLVISFVVFLVMDPLVATMTDVAEVQSLIKGVLNVKIWVMPIGYTFSFIIPAAMRSSGDAKYVMFVNVLTMFTMRLGVAYYLTHIVRWGILGIWLGQYADWGMRICLFMPRFLSGKWLEFDLLENKKEAHA